ncbi:MAG: hypothetical protein R6U98_22635 [Pirellulaceae bacterium]
MESCPTEAVFPLVGLAAEKVIRDRYATIWISHQQRSFGSENSALLPGAGRVAAARSLLVFNMHMVFDVHGTTGQYRRGPCEMEHDLLISNMVVVGTGDMAAVLAAIDGRGLPAVTHLHVV